MKNIFGCNTCGLIEIVPEGPEMPLAGICEECSKLMTLIGWMEDATDEEMLEMQGVKTFRKLQQRKKSTAR